MTEPPVGVRLTERLRGTVAGAHLDLTVTAVIALPDDSEPAPARVVGHVDHDPWGGRVPLADGRLVHEGDALVYRARARVGGRWVDIEARRELADDDGLDAWADATTVEFSASSGESGQLRLGPARRRPGARLRRAGRQRTECSTGPARWPAWPAPDCAARSTTY